MWNWDATISRKCTHEGCHYEVKHASDDAGYCSKPQYAHWNEPVNKWKDASCECGSKKARELSPSASYRHDWYCPSYKPF